MTGKWPTFLIDHRNGNGLDNRWENLREATQAENNLNARVRSDSVSQIKGVIGFDTPEAAREAYKKVAILLHKEFARFG